MCGRTSCRKPAERLRTEFGLHRFLNFERYEPAFNKSPGSCSPVIRHTRIESSIEKGGEREFVAMKWGFPSERLSRLVINARSESVAQRPMFRNLLSTNRCVIVADGYYEWQKLGSGVKKPYFLHFPEEETMLLAGLYTEKHGENVYTVLTADAPKNLAWLHHRVPVILTRDAAEKWLSESESSALSVLGSFEGELITRPVSSYVNNARNQGEQCIQKVQSDTSEYAKPQKMHSPRSTERVKSGKGSILSFFQPKDESKRKLGPAEEESQQLAKKRVKMG